MSLTFSVVATAVLSDLWSKEWTTLLLSFQVTPLHPPPPPSVWGSPPDARRRFVSRQQVTAPYLHVGGVLLVTALAWPIAFYFFRMSGRGEAPLVCSFIQSVNSPQTTNVSQAEMIVFVFQGGGASSWACTCPSCPPSTCCPSACILLASKRTGHWARPRPSSATEEPPW